MFSFRYFKYILSALFVVTLTGQLSYAASAITMEQSGVINGNNMDGVSGIELTVNYDMSLVSSPTVTKGGLISKGMLAANTSLPGVIRIAIISTAPFSGSGQIATISFATNSGNGGIKSISAKITDNKGTLIPVQTTVGTLSAPASSINPAATTPITVPGIPFNGTTSATSSTTTAQTTAPAATTTSPPTLPASGYSTGTVTLEPDPMPTKPEPQIPAEVKPVNQENLPQHKAEPDKGEAKQVIPAKEVTIEDKKYESRQDIVFKGVAEHFKAYRGDKSLPIMTALFRKEISKFISQKPPVALSDGKSRITIIIDIPTGSTTSPNFALDNATILSVKKEGGKNLRWIIEAIPEVNTWKATLSIIAGENSYEYPLTVAPRLGKAIKTDQDGWNAFLKKDSSQKNMYDLNNDGVSDYIDEFIFVANHLAGN